MTKKKIKPVKGWAVTNKRGRIFYPHYFGGASSIFRSEKIAKDWIASSVHPDHSAKVIPVLITPINPK
jgi:hypothetical protein